ncbi:phosphate ABC transporter membrane protein 2, PhoT family [Marininema mesophilum]|uniref:Phosphate transport system permease protein PstA n=1 Tax=Marininema mesophilum TaxID=1048340 RepID=A0A1H2XT53_9BACL|nr:phosphate ABC transporter permease PstA [Marininema mesophilum]SDW96011.1 phosphate ABC transporter membrane protein 2, PhoT family [Marininema mesophilum]
MSAEKAIVHHQRGKPTPPDLSLVEKRESSHFGFRRWKNRCAHAIFLLSTMVGVFVLGALLWDVVEEGWAWVTPDFFNNFASRLPEQAGIKAAFWGTLWVIGLTIPLTFILGIGTAIYLEEYARKNRFTRFIQLNISNLAGVPSIVFGILGLTLFVRLAGLGKTVVAGSLTMTLLILPIVIVAAREAISSVPNNLRFASFAMGATQWQTIRRVVLPYSMPGILTGVILALSRAIGETAPLLMIGAVSFIAFTPGYALDAFTVMPIQIYNWVSQPQAEFQHLAAAGILILLAMLLSMNAFAVFLRNRFARKDR